MAGSSGDEITRLRHVMDSISVENCSNLWNRVCQGFLSVSEPFNRRSDEVSQLDRSGLAPLELSPGELVV
jgi:hypothetical protein